jgi:4-amino-4-deoxy-L-arabinose transferase-like glycosyltransferase
MKRQIKILHAHRPLIFILLLGIIIRAVYFLFYYWSPEWEHLLIDSLFHDRWAWEIAGGNLLGQEPYFRAPFYIYLLGGIYAAFGRSLVAARIFGHMIGLIGVALTYLLAARLFSKREAIIAGIIHALYPIAIYFESELLVETLFAALVEASILFLIIALDGNKKRLYALAGVSAGLAIITRPVFLPLIPIYLLWIWQGAKEKKGSFIGIIILLIAMTAAMAPVTIRNLLVGDDFVLVASSGGVNFYIGNNPSTNGLDAAFPQIGASWQIEDAKYAAEKEAGRSLKPSELSDFYYKKGFEWILGNKYDFARLYMKKIYYFFNNYEVSNNRDLALFFRANPILFYNPLNFAIIFSLAVMALIIFATQGKLKGDLLFLSLIGMAYALVICMFFVNARFRLPIVPLLIIAASSGAVEIVALLRNGRARKKGTYVCLTGLVVFAFSMSNIFRADKDNISSGLFNLANYHFYRGDYDRAIEDYRQVLIDKPNYPEANLNLGAAFLKKGLSDSAEYYFKQEMKNYPINARAHVNLGSLYYLEGNYAQANESADRAIILRPYMVDGYLLKMRALAALNDTAGVAATISAAIKSMGENGRLLLDAGLIYTSWNKLDSAEIYLKGAFNFLPKSIETGDDAFSYGALWISPEKIKARAAYQLGYIYGIRNELDASIAMSQKAIELDSSLVEAYMNLINGYRLKGDIARARTIMNRAKILFPDYLPLRNLDKQEKPKLKTGSLLLRLPAESKSLIQSISLGNNIPEHPAVGQLVQLPLHRFPTFNIKRRFRG